jgi:hypothetical protein
MKKSLKIAEKSQFPILDSDLHLTRGAYKQLDEKLFSIDPKLPGGSSPQINYSRGHSALFCEGFSKNAPL